MSVGLIAALPVEARYAIGRNITTGTPVNINNNLVVSVSGMGPERAARAARLLIEEGVDGLISWGTSAALTDDLKAGDLVLPDKVYGHDGGDYTTDDRWRDSIRHCIRETILTCHVGVLAETPGILATVEEKTALHQRTGAQCADMETAAIVAAAEEAGLPAVAVRAIVDERHVILPTSLTQHLDEYGKPHLLRLTMSLFFNPSLIPRVWQLAHAMQKARRTLETVRRAADERLQFNQ